MREWIRRYAKRDVHLFQGFLVFQYGWSVMFGGRVRRQGSAFVQIGELFADQFDDALVIEISGGSNQYVLGRVNAVVVIKQHPSPELLNCLFGSQNWIPETVALPEIADE